MSERDWWLLPSHPTRRRGKSDSEVMREILLDENGEPRDGVVPLCGRHGEWHGFDRDLDYSLCSTTGYVIPAEMVEADDG